MFGGFLVPADLFRRFPDTTAMSLPTQVCRMAAYGYHQVGIAVRHGDHLLTLRYFPEDIDSQHAVGLLDRRIWQQVVVNDPWARVGRVD